MKATCSSCSNVVSVDETNPKIPDGPFNVKCPKCQQLVRFPGKKAAVSTPSPAGGDEEVATEEEMEASPSPAAAPASSTKTPAPPPAVQAPPPPGPPAFVPVPPTGEKALVAMNDKTLAAAITKTLKNLGYTVDVMTDSQALRYLDMGTYLVVAMARTIAEGPGMTCYQRLSYISADARRSFFLILAGPEYTTGDGTQAFLVNGDLVVHAQDAGSCEILVRDVLIEKNRLFRIFVESKRRADAIASA